MSPCDDFVELIMEFVDGELVGQRRQRLLQHLQECEQCAAQVRKMRLLRVQLRNLPRVATSPGFDTVLRARLRALERAPWRSVWQGLPFASWRMPTLALAVAVLCLTALGALFLLRHGPLLAGRDRGAVPAAEFAQTEPEDSSIVVNYVLDSVPIDLTVLGRGVPLATAGNTPPSDSIEKSDLVPPPTIRPRMVSF